MTQPPIQYEDRFVAYIDILGWSDASLECTPEVVGAITHLHQVAKNFSSAEKARTIEGIQSRGPYKINPIWHDHQVGAFSDNIVVSNSAPQGARILGSAGDVQRRLLALGFLCRGGISFGKVYHRDSVIMGPALVKAVCLEKTANMPRIVVSNDALAAMRSTHEFDEKNSFYTDEDGLACVNYLPTPAMFAADAERQVRGFLEADELERSIAGGILTSKANQNHSVKWDYARRSYDRLLLLAVHAATQN